MWVMIIKEIPVAKEHRPQRLGIYWAVPYPNGEIAREQFIKALYKSFDDYPSGKEVKRIKDILTVQLFENLHIKALYPKEYKDQLERFYNRDILYTLWGREQSFAKSMGILVNEEKVRIFQEELSYVDNEKMKFYLDNGWELQSGDVVEEKLQNFVIDNLSKEIYEAAILDGCSEQEAKLMALGVDITTDNEIPPLGWYKAPEGIL